MSYHAANRERLKPETGAGRDEERLRRLGSMQGHQKKDDHGLGKVDA
jgi:hypothetical protein